MKILLFILLFPLAVAAKHTVRVETATSAQVDTACGPSGVIEGSSALCERMSCGRAASGGLLVVCYGPNERACCSAIAGALEYAFGLPVTMSGDS